MIGFQRCFNTKLRLIVLKSTLFNSEFGCLRWISSDAMGSYSCRVIVSRVPCIYSNLALEDWLYEKTGTDVNQRLLLMWRSSPCVVIGKFQNQWQECNYGELSKHAIKLARRKSGGGTVYHDRGNINLSFITHRQNYNRTENLHFICEALSNTWPHLNLKVTDRDDILLDGKYKISGTAAKLSRDKAYHHCTLLVNSDKRILKASLQSPVKDQITSNASASVPAPTSCISTSSHYISEDDVVQCLADRYTDVYGGNQADNEQHITIDEEHLNDTVYPGIDDIRNELSSFQWIYGRTPKFTVTHQTKCGETLTIHVEKGHLTNFTITKDNCTEDLTGTLAGLPFCPVTIPMILHHNLPTLQTENPYYDDVLDLFRKIKSGTS